MRGGEEATSSTKSGRRLHICRPKLQILSYDLFSKRSLPKPSVMNVTRSLLSLAGAVSERRLLPSMCCGSSPSPATSSASFGSVRSDAGEEQRGICPGDLEGVDPTTDHSTWIVGSGI